jgi:23S rRNA (guanine745-N1)-methyltransferase
VRTTDGSKYSGDEGFRFRLAPVTKGAPMPTSNTIAVKAGKRVGFGNITFYEAGEYLYSITEAEIYNSLMEYLKDSLLPLRDKVRSEAMAELCSQIDTLANSEYYKTVNEKLSELAVKVTPPRGCVLDIGCGEGYYTEFIQRAIEKRDGSAQIYAFDISKDATALAARRVPSVGFAVASAYDMPIADGTVDTAVNMFSPLATGEIYRSLNANGHFIMAIPGVEHLFGLKSKLYSEPYKNTVNDPEIEGFELVTSESITYEIKLESNEDIRNLFGMTPYAYRTGKEGRELIEKLEKLETTVDFIIFAYKKVQ